MHWTKPISISNNDVGNACILYIKESGRLFIFFREYAWDSLIMVTRAPGSSIFSARQTIEHAFWWPIRATYNLRNDMPILHVFYTNGSDYDGYIKSENNGLTWTKAKSIHSTKYDTHAVFVASDPQISNTVYSMFFYTLCV